MKIFLILIFLFQIIFVHDSFIQDYKTISNIDTHDKMYNEDIDNELEGNKDIKDINNFLTAEDEENDNNLFEGDSEKENEIEDEVDGHDDNFNLI